MKVYLRIAVFCLIAFCSASTVFAATHLIWGTSSGEVEGYRIYYSTTEGSYTLSNSVDVGLVNQYPFDNLPLDDSTYYYFVIRAYNQYGESENSDSVVWQSNDNTPPLPPVEVAVQ